MPNVFNNGIVAAAATFTLLATAGVSHFEQKKKADDAASAKIDNLNYSHPNRSVSLYRIAGYLFDTRRISITNCYDIQDQFSNNREMNQTLCVNKSSNYFKRMDPY